MTIDSLLSGIPLAIAVGLFFGKQIGVFGFAWLSIKLGLAKLPANVNWGQMYGASILCGVGFTMSLFIGSLAFEESGLGYSRPDRLGIIVGSLAAGILGFVVLKLSTKSKTSNGDRANRFEGRNTTMSQSILLKRLALAALVACLVSSCARNSEPHSHDEVTALKSELEQLANQVGRLEFRIYELENHSLVATIGGQCVQTGWLILRQQR